MAAPQTPKAAQRERAGSPPRASANEPLVPPLYARFATTSSSSIDTDARTSRPAVSGPISLAGARKGAPGGGSGGGSGAVSGNRSPLNSRNGVQQSTSGAGYFPQFPAISHSEASPYTSASGTHFHPVGSNTASPRMNYRQNSSDSPVTSNASFERHLNGPDVPSGDHRRFMGTSNMSHSTTSIDKPLPMPSPLVPVSAAPPSPSNANVRPSFEEQQLQDDLRMLYNTDLESAYPDIRHHIDIDSNKNGSAGVNDTSPTRTHIPTRIPTRTPNEASVYKSLPPPPPESSASVAIPTPIYTRAPQPDPSRTAKSHHAPSSGSPSRSRQQEQMSLQPVSTSPTKEQSSSPPPVKRSSFSFGIKRLSLSRGSSSQSDTPTRSATLSKAQSQPPSATRDTARAGRASLDTALSNVEAQRGRDTQKHALHSRVPSSPPVSSVGRSVQPKGPMRAASVASSAASSARRQSQPQTTFGDFWLLPLPPPESKGSSSSRRSASSGGPPLSNSRLYTGASGDLARANTSGTVSSSSATHSQQSSDFASAQSAHIPFQRQQPPSQATTGLSSPVIKRESSGASSDLSQQRSPVQAQPTSHPPPQAQVRPAVLQPPTPSSPSQDQQSQQRVSSSSPPLIGDEEFAAYIELMRERPASSVTEPVQMNIPQYQPQPPQFESAQAQSQDVRQVQPPQVGHARRTSVQARKGPLIFNTTDETETESSRVRGAQVSRSPERQFLKTVSEAEIPAEHNRQFANNDNMQTTRLSERQPSRALPDPSNATSHQGSRAYPSPPVENVPMPRSLPRQQMPMSNEFEKPISSEWGSNVPSQGVTSQEVQNTRRPLPSMPQPQASMQTQPQRRPQEQPEPDARQRSHYRPNPPTSQPPTSPPPQSAHLPSGAMSVAADPRLRQSPPQPPVHSDHHAPHQHTTIPAIPSPNGNHKPRRVLTKARHGTAPAPAPAPVARPVTPPASPQKPSFVPDPLKQSDERQHRHSGVVNGGDPRRSRGDQLPVQPQDPHHRHDDRQKRTSGIINGGDPRLSRGDQLPPFPQELGRKSLPDSPEQRSQPDMSMEPLVARRRTRTSANIDEKNSPAMSPQPSLPGLTTAGDPARRRSQHVPSGNDDLAMRRRSRQSANLDGRSPHMRAQIPPLPNSPEMRLADTLSRPENGASPLIIDSIAHQSATAGPYDPVIPRPRSRPLTIFSMTAFSLTGVLSDPSLLFCLINYLTVADWLALWSVSKHFRKQLEADRDLREEVLERYLETIGYERWVWDSTEPLQLTLKDVNDYMRGVSVPNHQYARMADQCLRNPGPASIALKNDCLVSTLAYSRVVVRLRAQAEAAEAEYIARHIPGAPFTNPPVAARNKSRSRPSSRAPSPDMSTFSHSQHGHSSQKTARPSIANLTQQGSAFRSPLFKLRRAPLLRVFVPSPDGDWLSDASVLECEAQLRRAGVTKLLRAGDVIWDVAVGDEGNIGKLVWDGNFLIDLDYSYSTSGDLPQYLHTLAFPPSYFHRVIRTGPATSPQGSNPIVHINISPWGADIATNLQLLQDRMRTETPQGSHHNVVRWVHRSSFDIRPPPAPVASRYGPNRTRIPPPRIPIPSTDLFVDPGWYGTVVVEAEGTNEGLADLQERCGTGIFPKRPREVIRNPGNLKPRDGRKVFRLLREKSRPGEIWLRTVTEKERLM
ncbi:hypothetical protein HWV62_18050 [Athelia sp. TMB]|nr:hypothetical protein HWV62_18050 [Athelia sp. TMB]